MCTETSWEGLYCEVAYEEYPSGTTVAPPKYRANILPAISVSTTQKLRLVGGMSLARRR